VRTVIHNTKLINVEGYLAYHVPGSFTKGNDLKGKGKLKGKFL